MSESTPPETPPPPRKRRTWVIVVVVLVAVGLLVLGGCAALVFTVFNKASDSLDPANNQNTGLADGRYSIRPTAYVRVQEDCSFTGTPYSFDSTPVPVDTVTVVGQGPIECGTFDDNADTVIFTVSGGVAQIVDVVR